ncbi:MAG: antibiotic biosynthesis monooxygenase family protein [Planctomycetota bacterium]|jgi:quinol monooxygenase YgiN
MIIRFFRAIVHDGQAEAFAKLFVETILPLIRAQEGLISASIGLPHETSPNEFAMIMHWRDLEAVQRFAGEDWQNAVIHPDEAHLLKETCVHHYIADVE